MSMIKNKDLISEIKKSVETIANNGDAIFPEAATFGEYARQGDIYITLIEKVPQDSTIDKNPKQQVAPGNTKGSRHILDSLEGVIVHTSINNDVLQGPILEIKSLRKIAHPEHGNIILNEGIYDITFQRAFGEERKRALD